MIGTGPRSSPRRRQAAVTPLVALVDRTSAGVPLPQVEAVASVLQKQLDRDFAPVWDRTAKVVAAPRGAAPSASWPILLVDPLMPYGGIHLSANGRPNAEVAMRANWPLVASHELKEMLVDPFGRRMQPGPSIDPAAGGRTVEYLVEVVDPCEADHYTIDGIEVSSFVTPAYFGLAPGPPYDMLGHISGPFGLPPGGCLSWWDPLDRQWHEAHWGYRFYTGAFRDAAREPRADRDRALGFRRARG